MEQHPVPQNIATFEFKLFGNLTVRQFVTLIIPVALAAVIFFSNAFTPIIRIIIAGLIGLFGFIIAVVPFNGRPFDKWVVSFIKAILAPTERIWIKEKRIPEFLTVVTNVSRPEQKNPQEVTAQGRERLLAYLRSLPNEKQSALDIREQVAVEGLSFDNTNLGAGRLPPTIIWEKPQPKPEVEHVTDLPPAPQILAHAETRHKPKFITKMPKLPAFMPKAVHFAQKSQAQTLAPQKIEAQPEPAKIVKISSYARPYVLSGLEQKLSETKFEHVKARPIKLKAHLASETNYTMQNIIPIQTAQNEFRLIPSVGQIRVRKLHFAPPLNFDLSNLPVRGEKTFDVSDELKKRFQNSEQSLLNAFSEQVPKAIIQPAPAPQIQPAYVPKKTDKNQKRTKNVMFVPKPQGAYNQKPNVKGKVETTKGPDTQVSFWGKKVHGQEAQTIAKPQMLPFTTKPNVLSGLITGSNGIPIESAVIVVRDQNGIPVRALKTNKLGQFLSVTPLSSGTYTIEIEAANSHFAPRSITLDNKILQPIEIQGES